METTRYMGKTLFDNRRLRHRITSVVLSKSQSNIFNTEAGDSLKLCHGDANYELYNERIDWLQTLYEKGRLNDLVFLPKAKLT